MAKNFSITRADIINSALRKIGEYDQAEAPSGDETEHAALALNLMVKEWQSKGIDLFLRQEATLFLQPQSRSYLLGKTGSAHATTSYVETTLSADEASGQRIISVTSPSGMAKDDHIGIKLDDDSIFWSTIATVGSSTVTIRDSTTGAASSGNSVYAYTTKADRPQRLLYVFRRDNNGLDTEVAIVGENEYQRLSNKGSEGAPLEVYYRPTLDTGTLYVWPVDGGAIWDRLILITQVLSDDLDGAGDNPQFPIEWGNALIWGLAAEMAPEYGIPRMERREITMMAKAKLDDLLDYDVENTDVRFVMGR